MKRSAPLKRTGFKRKEPLWRPIKIGDVEVPGLRYDFNDIEYVKLPKLPPIPRKKPKTTVIRKSAKGKPCLIRLPGCDGGGETTVLCHYRLAGYCGTGMKPPDEFGAYMCHNCHAIVDGRAPRPEGYTQDAVMRAFGEAVMRTQHLIRMSNASD